MGGYSVSLKMSKLNKSGFTSRLGAKIRSFSRVGSYVRVEIALRENFATYFARDFLIIHVEVSFAGRVDLSVVV